MHSHINQRHIDLIITRILWNNPHDILSLFLHLNRSSSPIVTLPSFPGIVALALSHHPSQVFACRTVLGLAHCRTTRSMANSLLRALSYDGDHRACHEWLQEMERSGIRPNATSHAHMVLYWSLAHYHAPL